MMMLLHVQGESVDKKMGQGTCLPFNFLTFKKMGPKLPCLFLELKKLGLKMPAFLNFSENGLEMPCALRKRHFLIDVPTVASLRYGGS